MKFRLLAVVMVLAVILLGCETTELPPEIKNVTSKIYNETKQVIGLSNETIPHPTPIDICSRIWRYNLTCALKYALAQSEISKIKDLALELKGKDIKESAWNIVEWEDKNIKYDWQKAALPMPEIVYYRVNGIITDVKVVEGQNNIYQTPYETIQRGKGVCRDYAILTAGLLLAMGYSPVYIFHVEFEGSMRNHTAAGINIHGNYFVIDQHPPVMDLGTYYMHWKYYTTTNRSIIKKIDIYEVKPGKDLAEVRFVETLSGDELRRYDYTLKTSDLDRIRLDLAKMLESSFNLIKDPNIRDIDKTYLPRGYVKGITWTWNLPNYVDHYNLEFHEEFVKFIYKRIIKDDRVVRDLNYYNHFYLKIERDGNNLKIILNLAKT